MSLFKLSNQIFTLGLSNAALSVYSYLCSIKVKQKTIAVACGIASIQTVAKALRELTEQGNNNDKVHLYRQLQRLRYGNVL